MSEPDIPPSPDVRAAEMPTTDTLAPLLRRLCSMVPSERVEAGRLLASADPAAVVELVLGHLAQPEDPRVRRDMVAAVAATRSDRAIEPLLQILSDPDQPPPVRGQAAEGLGRLMQFSSRGHHAYPTVANELTRALTDRAPAVRLWAARACGVAHVKRARDRLRRMGRRDHARVDDVCWGTVRDEARAALAALDTGVEVMWPVIGRAEPSARARIRELVLERLDRPTEQRRVEDMVARADAIPLLSTPRGCFGLRTDGHVIFWPWATGAVEPELRPPWRVAAIVAGRQVDRVVRILIPARPDAATDCRACGGRGRPRLGLGRKLGPVCASCWGLGWSALPNP